MKRLAEVAAWWRSAALLLLAAGAGLLAAWSAGRHIQSRVELIEMQAQVPMVERLVADDDLPEGANLHAGMLAVRSFPEAWISADALHAEDMSLVEGRELAYPVRRGDAVLLAHLAGARPRALSSRLATGRRAVTLPVADLNVQTGLLAPGDKLDIYVSFDRGGTSITAPLLQAVRVMATGHWQEAGLPDEAEARDYTTVTFDLSPDDAAKLMAARHEAELTGLLRHPDDATSVGASARGDVAALLGMPAVPRPKPAPVILYGDAPDADSGAESGPGEAS